MTGAGQTFTQLRMPDKTHETTSLAALLAPYDLTGVTVTTDALHTQRDHARHLFEDKGAHYAFTVKRNQKGVYEQLRALPWGEVRAKFHDRSTGHGRLETRVVQVLTVTDLGVDLPYAARHRRRPARDVLPALRTATAPPRAQLTSADPRSRDLAIALPYQAIRSTGASR
ncbi:transposase [Streptomyces sp. NBC_00996]|uniref:transposase n=1 Tax=Streptomyces sp. NBC_00996 TaxID=2903710 RepID=UPI00386C23BA|nr:transposase [Streptomyces sp. NBC_00996]